MALILSNPNAAGPFQTFQRKDVQVHVVKLAAANFATTNVDTYVASLPPDIAIIGFDIYVKTVLSGNGVTSPTVSLGSSSGGTQFSAALAVTNTAGTNAKLSPVTGICQEQDPTNRTDIKLFVRGGCSTGNPTAGEIDLIIKFVR